MMKIRITIILSIIAFPLLSQTKDFGLWTGLQLSAELSKKFSLSVEEMLRMEENASKMDVFYSEAGIEYKINKAFRASVNYRHSYSQSDYGYFFHRSRFNGDVSYRLKIDDLSFKYRLRYEQEYRLNKTSDEDRYPENCLRNKASISYSIKDFSPYLSYELFSPIVNRDIILTEKSRSAIGVSYEINKHWEVDLFFLFQRTYEMPVDSKYILGISSGYSF